MNCLCGVKKGTCKEDHEHDVCMGGKDINEHAGRYTKETAEAIHRGFGRVLKRKEPGRIRNMLRCVAARIRTGDQNKAHLRWSEKSINKALGQWNAAFANSVADQDMPLRTNLSHHRHPQDRILNDREIDKSSLSVLVGSSSTCLPGGSSVNQ